MASVVKRKNSRFWTACCTSRDGHQLKHSPKTTDKNQANEIAIEFERIECLAMQGLLTTTQIKKSSQRRLRKGDPAHVNRFRESYCLVVVMCMTLCDAKVIWPTRGELAKQLYGVNIATHSCYGRSHDPAKRDRTGKKTVFPSINFQPSTAIGCSGESRIAGFMTESTVREADISIWDTHLVAGLGSLTRSSV